MRLIIPSSLTPKHWTVDVPDSQHLPGERQQLTRQSVDTETDTIVKTYVRHDDELMNGHNTFTIIGDRIHRGHLERCGAIHGDIAEAFPDLAGMVKWHLCSTNGPMRYMANTRYWAREHFESKKLGDDLDATAALATARRTAIWPDADPMDLLNEGLLVARLPGLLEDFKADVESLGLTY